ncbi:hypothetical protein TSOC_001879 [Tetrabaena socialis]|uniref:EF-hand domain-containing protein n=1 Tax=Tetrabaena socialis TaxID=47790 RepID=A0A2J8AFH9_9CHLO|nr:hypothetical protein TSOC_001879 [Tetrabaena socialis]|eukprot:PNH11278.1 hypothetical protein TSOC_001879 [Tetrabaena socialis]
MGAGCSSGQDQAPKTLANSGSGGRSQKGGAGGAGARSIAASSKADELAANFVAEYPSDDEPDDTPSYPEGSREATLLNVYYLLDKANLGYITIPDWKDYIRDAGLTMEALAHELGPIVADQAEPGDPRVTARQFVNAMVHMTADMDDRDFGHFVAQTLQTYRTKGASQKSLAAGEEEEE